jgi:hypothetical protein
MLLVGSVGAWRSRRGRPSTGGKIQGPPPSPLDSRAARGSQNVVPGLGAHASLPLRSGTKSRAHPGLGVSAIGSEA